MPDSTGSVIQVVVLLRAGAAGIAGLRAYEHKALPILREHGGKLISAFVPAQAGDGIPDEVHVLEFPSAAHLEAYRDDTRIVALAPERNAALSATTVFVSEQFVDYSG